MKKQFALSIFVAVLILDFLISKQCFPLEKETHKALNEHIAKTTVNNFELNSYLGNQLGLRSGIETILNGKEVWKWIRDGGAYEDEPMYTRSFNHFHNPLKTWDRAGFKGTFQSSIIWAQDQGAFGSLWGGNFSWNRVREYFYIGLTGKDFNGTLMAYTQSEKEKYYSKTFQGIGQIMHLVQDVSVPAHTRNDAHVIAYHYELAVDKFRKNFDPVFAEAVANPIIFDPAIRAYPSNPLAPIPIASIWDTDRYDPVNPDPLVTVGGAIGLSEYTNANFVSEGLLSANFRDFPYPRSQDTAIIGKAITSPLGTYTRQYYSKNCCGETNSGHGYLLAAVDYLDYWRQKHPLLSAGLPKIPVLDDNVYKDYAALLIPRAVGYSAGLLYYFFRGDIEITLPNSGVYALAENGAVGFREMKLLARNTSANGEEMTDGTIELVIGYRRAIDDPFVNYPEDYAFRAENEMSYIVVPEKNGIRSIPSNESVELTFDLSQTPVPLQAINLLIRLIYHGRLGNEDGAVVVGFKDISEPTPVDLFNDMDRICLNGSFYTAGSQDAIDLVDKGPDGNHNNIADEWDVYAHHMTDIYFKFSSPDYPVYASPSDYDISIPSIYAGDSIRVNYILTDYNFLYNSMQSLEGFDPEDLWSHSSSASNLYPGIAIKNQMEYEEDPAVCAPMSAPCHIWWYPTFLEYRGVNLWWGGGIMHINNAYPQGSECTCYQDILRNCITGVKTLKSFDYVRKSNVLKKHRGEYTTEENTLQMLPLMQKQRRMPMDE